MLKSSNVWQKLSVTNQNQKKRLVDGLAGSETGIGAVLGRFTKQEDDLI